MKKYLIITIILLSSSIYGFGEILSVKKLTDNDKSRTINSIAYLINNGKSVNFKEIEGNQEWFKSGNIKLKESKRGYSLLFDETKFMKETDDKFIIEDSKTKFKASKKSIEKLKLKIKEKADKILKDYFPNDNYVFHKVGVDTVGIRDEEGRVVESISMLSPIYVKTINSVKIQGKDTATRLYFKPSGKLIGIKLVNLKSINTLTQNDKEIVKSDIVEINNYLKNKYKNSYRNLKVNVLYRYLKKGDELIPVYFMNINLGDGSKKLFRFLPLSDFNGVDSIERVLLPSRDNTRGNTK